MGTVGIGVAWAIMAMAAFVALSASALARTRHELEVDPRGTGSEIAAERGRRDRSPSAQPHAHRNTHWPAVEMAPTSAALRSSPSVAYMHAATGHAGPGPIHFS